MSSRHPVTRSLVAAALVAALPLAACGSHAASAGRSTTAARAPQAAQRVPLTGAELRYGRSVQPGGGVVYQPNVVIIRDGADAVRGVSANGLSWTIDAHAAGAAQLAVGKIMLATSFAAGRIVKLAKRGATEQVVLAPVAVTDVIRDANIRSTAPVALADPLYYPTPGAPGAESADQSKGDAPDTARSTPLTGTRPVATLPTPSAPAPPVPTSLPTALPAPTTAPQAITTGEAETKPFLDSRGLGAELFVQHGDGRFDASVSLSVDRPTASFVLDIADGVVKEASVRLHGAGALTVRVTAAQESGDGAFAGKRIQIPVTLVIPLGGPAPLYLSITQGFRVTDQIIGKGSIQTHGTYRLIGDLYFGIRNNRPLLSATTMAVVDPMDRNTIALGLAANTVELGWRVTAEVGVGLLGFSAGAWYKLGFATTFTADSGLDVLHPGCVTNSVVLRGQFGIGYHVPDVVMKAVNFFLGVFGAKQIPASGGLMSKYVPLWQPAPAKYCPGYDH